MLASFVPMLSRRGVVSRVLAQALVQGRRRWLAAKGIPIVMPALSPTMTSGKIVKWSKKEGDQVTGGDVIAEIETDKATIDFSHQDDGFLAKIIQPAGSEDIHVGTVLALMVEDAKDIAEVQASAAPAKAPSPAAPAVSPPAAPVAPAPSTSPAAAPAAPLAQHEALPSARILMANLGVDPAALRNRGTGKAGRITKGDVQAFVSGTGSIAAGAPAVHAASPVAHAAAAAAAPAAPAAPSAPAPASALAADFGRYTDSKPSNVRKVIASRLTESKARIPHEYAVMDCRIDALLKLRAQLKAAGVAVSVNDMVVKAVAKAMVDVPEVNRFFDAKAGVVRAGSAAGVDVCVAVATDGGLITPIVKSADRLGLFGINEAVKDLATRARAGKLQPAEFQGGAFTISNLGMFGIDEFSAVINPPQACIMAVGRGEPKVLFPPITSEADLDPAAPAPQPSVVTVMTVTLSSDARVVDAATAGQFLQLFRHYIESPALLVA